MSSDDRPSRAHVPVPASRPVGAKRGVATGEAQEARRQHLVFQAAPRPTMVQRFLSGPANAMFAENASGNRPRVLPFRLKTWTPAEVAAYTRPSLSMARPSAARHARSGLRDTLVAAEVAAIGQLAVRLHVVARRYSPRVLLMNSVFSSRLSRMPFGLSMPSAAFTARPPGGM